MPALDDLFSIDVARRVFDRMSATELRRIRNALVLDRADALRRVASAAMSGEDAAARKQTVAFCQGRIAIIDELLTTRE